MPMTSIYSIGLYVTLLLCVLDPAAAIKNGQKNKRKNKYTAYITYDGELQCSGSLIADRWVLTAAKCLNESDSSLYNVVLGDTFIKKTSDGQVIADVEEIFTSCTIFWDEPRICTDAKSNDVALIYLTEAVNTSLSIIDVVGVSDGLDSIIDKGKSCTLSSYGDVAPLANPGPLAKWRQKLTVEFGDDSLCSVDNALYGEDNVCWADKKYRRKTDRVACRGDAGAPIVCKVGKKYMQLAMNLEDSCSSENNVGLNLENGLEWIANTMKDVNGLVGEPTEDYPNKKILRSGQYQLYWRTNDTDITYEVHVATQAWVGLGFSDGGSMWPGDVVVGYVSDEGECNIADYYTVGFRSPVMDDIQNVQLVACRQTEEGTMLKFNRPLNTTAATEDQDRSVLAAGNHVIFAFGQTDTLSYHFSNRGSMFFSLL